MFYTKCPRCQQKSYDEEDGVCGACGYSDDIMDHKEIQKLEESLTPKNSPFWEDFAEMAKKEGINLDHKDDYMPSWGIWWHGFVCGAGKVQKIIKEK